MARAPDHLRAAPRGTARAPDHLRVAPGGMADFSDHRSRSAPPPHIDELRPPPPSSAFLTLSWSSQPCQAGSPCALGAHGEDLAVVRVVAAHHRPRHGCRFACACHRHRALCVLQSAERALRPGRHHCHVGRAPHELDFDPKAV
jgi:hypothetical protein